MRPSLHSVSLWTPVPRWLLSGFHANYCNQTQVFLILHLTHLLTAVSWVFLPLQTSLNHAPLATKTKDRKPHKHNNWSQQRPGKASQEESQSLVMSMRSDLRQSLPAKDSKQILKIVFMIILICPITFEPLKMGHFVREVHEDWNWEPLLYTNADLVSVYVLYLSPLTSLISPYLTVPLCI